MWRHLRLLPVLALVILIQACTTIRLEPLPDGMTDQTPADWDARARQVSGFDQWRLTGKLAVRQPSDSGTALINHWIQSGESYDLALSSSFLGMGSTLLKGRPDYMELTLPGGDTYRSSDPESLVSAATGWQLPLQSLSWWIRGLPAPDDNARLLFNAEQQLALIRQSGWEIRYDRWKRFLPDLPALPARITAVKGEKRVRMVVAQWESLEDRP